MANEEYIKSIEKWHEERETILRRENGWLALSGLFWLRKGTNLVGSDPNCDILLPKRAPLQLGTFEFDGDRVTLNIEADLPVEVNGTVTQTALLDTDEDDIPSFITFNDMRMVVVRRSKGVGIRVWDNTREERRTFPPRQWFPISEAYRVPATYTRYETPKIVKMPDILGAVQDQPMHGYVTFEIKGQKFGLIVTEEPDRRLFIQFMDSTNGHTTYPSGRYYYSDPYEEGKVFFLDFNKAYNLPCAFTDYATCTFPPQENRLEIAIEVGETFPGIHH